MLDGLPSSSENCPCVDECQQYAMERMGHATNYMLHRYQEYLRSKESEVNDSLMSALENLNPSSPLSNSSQSDNANATPA